MQTVFVLLEDDPEFQEEIYSQDQLDHAYATDERFVLGRTTHNMKIVDVFVQPDVAQQRQMDIDEVQQARLHAMSVNVDQLFLVGFLGEGPEDDYYSPHDNYLWITDVFDDEQAAHRCCKQQRQNRKEPSYKVLEFHRK